MKLLVISGINLFQGGTLSIFYDCMDEIKKMSLNKQYKIVLFVHKKELFLKYMDIAEIKELPLSRKNYFFRLYYEYVYFKTYSNRNHVDVWLSLHDITPNVKADRLYTYCHNPAPFMKKDFSILFYSPTVFLFSVLYKYVYMINIKRANSIIVQQEWLRQEFKKMFKIDNIIVARPKTDELTICTQVNTIKNIHKVFIYASYPRSFKNFEIICKACKIINMDNYEIIFTIDGSENRYSKALKKKYGKIRNIKWLGIQSREKLMDIYNESDALIFPSKIETWGLPISEFKVTNKDIIISDLPYAHETIGTYKKAIYFNPFDEISLANSILSVINGTQRYTTQDNIIIDYPYMENWHQLIDYICK